MSHFRHSFLPQPTALEQVQVEQARVALAQQQQTLAAGAAAVTNIRVAEQ